MATASYTINNVRGYSVFIENADGMTIRIDHTKIIALTDAGYQSAINIFGKSNVTLVGGGDQPYAYTPLGLQTMVLNSATAQPLTPPSGATTVQIIVSGNSVNYRDDGIAPTSSTGVPALVGSEFFLNQVNLSNVQFISQSGTATIILSFYR